MKKFILAVLPILIGVFMLCCSSPASDEQIKGMCQNLAQLSGELRGTSEEEATAKINAEYDFKENKFKEELARDLKGMDDVLTQKLADLGKAEVQMADDAETEKTPEKMKEEMKKSIIADIDKKKEALEEEFGPLFKVLGPQRKHAIKESKKYTAKRKQAADKFLAKCNAEAVKEAVSAATAKCRTKADGKDHYHACQ
jgi:hypothetical protein